MVKYIFFEDPRLTSYKILFYAVLIHELHVRQDHTLYRL